MATDSRFFSAYPTSSAMPSYEPVVQKHLRKVYSSLTTALLAASAGAILTLRLFARGVFWPATLASWLVVPALLFFTSQPPHSKLRAPLFHFFAFVDGVAAVPLLSVVVAVDPTIPAIAFGAASAVFMCCTMSALFAKRRSYLFLSSFLFTALFGFSILSLVSIFITIPFSFGLSVYGGLLLFCGFVLYDTQMIIEKAHAGERDHLQHALDLFIDFVAIFKRIAVIMAKNQQQRDENDRRRRRSSN